jgi:hypothetical protein
LCFNIFGEFYKKEDVLLNIFNEIRPNLMEGTSKNSPNNIKT